MTTTNTLTGLAAACLLAACNIDKLAAEFHVKASTETSTADTSASTGEGTNPGSSGGSTSDASTTAGSTGTGDPTSAQSTGDASSSGDTTGQPPAVCGDGIVAADEECDDANTDDLDDCSNDCARAFTVFVTSTETFTGNINGLDGADNRCRNAALNAPLPRGLNYTAFLSDSTTDAADRVHHARGWYRLVNGLPVARGWDALVTGPLLNPVNVNELSETANTMVWTGSTPNGVAVPGAEHCDDWTIESAVTTGHFGRSTEVDGNWLYFSISDTNPTDCYDMRALYCVEQP